MLETLVGMLAGYDPEDLVGVPADAVKGASGCGTPVAFSDLLQGEVVLDLESGAGLDLLLAARKVGPTGTVIGVDQDEISIDRARSNIAASGFDNVEVRRARSQDLPIADRSVDWVISNREVSLSVNKAQAFAEIHRVLKPGGRVCLADIVAEGLPERMPTCRPMVASSCGGVISEQAYVSGLAAAGLADIRHGGRYVFTESELTALVRLAGCAEGLAHSAADFAREAVGGVWSVYFFARKPLEPQQEADMQDKKKEDSDDGS